MSVSPMYVGQTGPALQATIQYDTGGAFNLTGASLMLIIHNPDTLQDIQGAGTWNIPNPQGGVAVYQWNVLDTHLPPDNYQLFISFAIAGVEYICDPIPWILLQT